MMWTEDLLSMHITSARFVTVSMHVNAWKVNILELLVTFHGPMRSMATSNHGATNVSWGGNWPLPGPDSFVLWQMSQDWIIIPEYLLSKH